MLAKIAIRNIKNSIRDYSIYFFTLLMGVAIFYMFNSIDGQRAIMEMSESKRQIIDIFIQMIDFISIFIAFVLGFIMIYANNFLIKRRSKEFGIYLLLGVNKKKISLIVLLETFFVGLISLAVGLVIGVFFGQLFSAFTVKIFKANLSDFAFVFSLNGLRNTIICFMAIFLIVGLFNVVTLSKTKLIDLINKKNQNEKMIYKKKRISVFLFILAVVFLGLGYYCIIDNNLQSMNPEFIAAFIFVFIGTILFFVALANTLLTILKHTKWYFKKLNLFIIKEVNKSINSNIGTMVVSCLLLAVTIVVLSTSFGLTKGINHIINTCSPYDISIYNEDSSSVKDDLNPINLDDFFKEYYEIEFFYDDNYSFTYFTGIGLNQTLRFVKESDFNKTMALQGESLISITDSEVYFASQHETYCEKINEKKNSLIAVFSQDMTIKGAKAVALSTNVQINDSLFVIVKDHYLDSYETVGSYLNAFYRNGIDDDDFINACEIMLPEAQVIEGCSRQNVKDVNTGFTAIITFVALYIAIIFMICCCVIIAIQHLSKIQDSALSYELLNELGVSKQKLRNTLLIQTLIYFVVPLVLALVHASIGIYVCNNVITELAPFDILKDIILSGFIFFAIYGLYFFITYISSYRLISKSLNN